MGQAALNLSETYAANDNPPGKGVDKWHWLIERFKQIHMPLAVETAQIRLSGRYTCEEFCRLFVAGLERLELQREATKSVRRYRAKLDAIRHRKARAV